MAAAFDQDGWLKEIAYQATLGPFKAIRTNDGSVRLSFGEHDQFVWCWPTSQGGGRMDFGEQLANVLAAADRRFEVRRVS